MNPIHRVLIVTASLVAPMLAPACSSGSSSGGGGGGGASLSAVSATTQSVPAGSSIALVVKVVDSSGKPLPGSTVRWAVAAGTGSISPASNATRGDGTATATATIAAGQNSFTATVDGASGSPATFTITGNPPRLAAISGNGQRGRVATALLLPFVVKVVDSSGTSLPNIAITWAATVGGGSIAPTSNTTGSDGTASATGTLGSVAGANTFTASSPGVGGSPITFTATGTPPQIVAVSGNGQGAPVGMALPQPFVVKVVDSNDTPVSNVTVTWAATGGGGSIAPTSNATGSDGTATATGTLGSAAGPNTFTASSPGVDGSPVTFSATATTSVPTTIALVSGDNQSAAGTTSLPLPFVVKVTDSIGRGVGGVAITWATSTAGASVTPTSLNTSNDGTAQATGTLPGPRGPVTFTATSNGLTGSPITFHATSLGALVYTDPPARGKLRLVRDASSGADSVALNLVANAAMTGYSAGFNLPLDATKVHLNATPLTPGTALSPGSSPTAAKVALPTSGPLQGVLVTAQSQKRSGTGAVATDSALSPGDVLYTIRLDVVAGSAAGTVFDGTTLPANFSGGLRNMAGTDVAGSADFAIGRLEVQ